MKDEEAGGLRNGYPSPEARGPSIRVSREDGDQRLFYDAPDREHLRSGILDNF